MFVPAADTVKTFRYIWRNKKYGLVWGLNECSSPPLALALITGHLTNLGSIFTSLWHRVPAASCQESQRRPFLSVQLIKKPLYFSLVLHWRISYQWY